MLRSLLFISAYISVFTELPHLRKAMVTKLVGALAKVAEITSCTLLAPEYRHLSDQDL